MFPNKLAETLGNKKLCSKTYDELVDLFDYYCKGDVSTQKLIKDTGDFFKFEKNSGEYKAMLEISKELDKGNFANQENSYHNLGHFKEVFISSVFLANLNNQDKQPPLALSKKDLSILCLAALTHDLSHDGNGNNGELFKLEQNSFDKAKPFFDKHKVSKENQAIIEAMILTTDINGPQQYAEKIYAKHFNNKKPVFDEPKEIKNKLKILMVSKKASYMSLMLDDADLLPSAGLTYEKALRQTKRLYSEAYKISEEETEKTKKEKTKDFFISFCNSLFKDGFSSYAGQKINVNHKKILSLFRNEKKKIDA